LHFVVVIVVDVNDNNFIFLKVVDLINMTKLVFHYKIVYLKHLFLISNMFNSTLT